MPLVARVVVENAAQSFDKIYSYRVPEGMPVRPGCRVTAPFGAGNRTRFGLAVAVEEEPDAAGLKPLATLVDPEPLLSDKLLSLVFWLRDNTFCTYFDAVKALLPPASGWSWNIPTSFPRTRPPPKTRRNAGFTTTSRGAGKPVREEALLAALGFERDAPVLRELCARGRFRRRRRCAGGCSTESSSWCGSTGDRGALRRAGETHVQAEGGRRAAAAGGRGVPQGGLLFRRRREIGRGPAGFGGAARLFTREIYRSPYAEGPRGRTRRRSC
ncbi:MAG: hypothetical protein ACLVL7_11920 [Anaerotruncus massiliensis (ex Togo et al. 2019)]